MGEKDNGYYTFSTKSNVGVCLKSSVKVDHFPRFSESKIGTIEHLNPTQN